jgi:hypothetical protein
MAALFRSFAGTYKGERTGIALEKSPPQKVGGIGAEDLLYRANTANLANLKNYILFLLTLLTIRKICGIFFGITLSKRNIGDYDE